MPYREKTAWLSIAVTLIVWGYYFARLLPAIGDPGADAGDYIGLFVGCTIVSILVQIALAIPIALMSRGEADARPDERETRIDAFSGRIAYLVLLALVATIALTSPGLIPAAPFLFPAAPTAGIVLVLANALFAALLVAEIVRSGLQIAMFRNVL